MSRNASKNKNSLYILIIFLLFFLFMKHFFYFQLNGYTKSHLQEAFYKNQHEFNLNPEDKICNPQSGKSILIIAFVILAPHHFEKRDQIRQTWGSKDISPDFKLIFMVGMSEDNRINSEIEKEYEKTQDIIQINNFVDSYYRLTTKIMKSFKWISKYCFNAKYILRLNDDVIVNTHHLIKHFRNLNLKKNQIFGNPFYSAAPVRVKDHKFYISEKVYPYSKYEDYVDGSAYILTADLAQRYYKEWIVFKYPPFSVWLEDVYIGMIAKRLNTSIQDYGSHYLGLEVRELSMKEKTRILSGIKITEIFFLYEKDFFSYYWNIFLKKSTGLKGINSGSRNSTCWSILLRGWGFKNKIPGC